MLINYRENISDRRFCIALMERSVSKLRHPRDPPIISSQRWWTAMWMDYITKASIRRRFAVACGIFGDARNVAEVYLCEHPDDDVPALVCRWLKCSRRRTATSTNYDMDDVCGRSCHSFLKRDFHNQKSPEIAVCPCAHRWSNQKVYELFSSFISSARHGDMTKFKKKGMKINGRCRCGTVWWDTVHYGTVPETVYEHIRSVPGRYVSVPRDTCTMVGTSQRRCYWQTWDVLGYI